MNLYRYHSAFPMTPDGLSIAKARADYIARRPA